MSTKNCINENLVSKNLYVENYVRENKKLLETFELKYRIKRFRRELWILTVTEPWKIFICKSVTRVYNVVGKQQSLRVQRPFQTSVRLVITAINNYITSLTDTFKRENVYFQQIFYEYQIIGYRMDILGLKIIRFDGNIVKPIY